ncbi:MAG: hypothetical protein IJY04_04600 [Clostridia bacterium]|nr:hypothetical protein [Clostridia bacterium]
MNGYQLRDTVCALGFVGQLEDENIFFHAANLALSRLRTVIPLRRTVKLGSYHPKPSIYKKSGECFSLHSPRGIGFCFEFIGSLTLEYSHGSDAFKEELVSEDGKFSTYARAFERSGSLTVEFSGDNSHSISNACIFDRLSRKGEPELYSEEFGYDMKNEDGFLSVLSVTGGEYRLSGSKVFIPRGGNAEYAVEYSFEPEPLSEDSMSAELGIDPCLSEAAALLTAYYVWLDDDASKAENYRVEYASAIERILAHRQVDYFPVVTNSW